MDEFIEQFDRERMALLGEPAHTNGHALSAVGLRKGSLPAPGALDVVCMADVKARPIEWLWNLRFALGKVSVLAGDGGQGKSTILCDLAARRSNGEQWPD